MYSKKERLISAFSIFTDVPSFDTVTIFWPNEVTLDPFHSDGSSPGRVKSPPFEYIVEVHVDVPQVPFQLVKSKFETGICCALAVKAEMLKSKAPLNKNDFFIFSVFSLYSIF